MSFSDFCLSHVRARSLALSALVFAFLASSFFACTPPNIVGTRIPDTPANRSVMTVLQSYKAAVEQRNVDALMSLVSERYFEDNANADPADDYGYSDLKSRVLPEMFNRLSEVRVELDVKDVKVQDDKARADVRFSYQAKMSLPAGEKWQADTEINRVEMKKEKGNWKIISGL